MCKWSTWEVGVCQWVVVVAAAIVGVLAIRPRAATVHTKTRPHQPNFPDARSIIMMMILCYLILPSLHSITYYNHRPAHRHQNDWFVSLIRTKHSAQWFARSRTPQLHPPPQNHHQNHELAFLLPNIEGGRRLVPQSMQQQATTTMNPSAWTSALHANRQQPINCIIITGQNIVLVASSNNNISLT